MVKKLPIDDSHRELLAQPSIDSQMPILFENGAKWESLIGDCMGCDEVIEPHLFTGRVSRPMETVAVVDAVGLCMKCNLVSQFHYRLHNDMRITGRTEEGWGQWKARPTTMFSKLLRSVQNAFR